MCYESGGDDEKGRAAGCGDVERRRLETRVLFWSCEAGGEVGVVFEEMRKSTAACFTDEYWTAFLGASSCGAGGRTGIFMEIGVEFRYRTGRVGSRRC